MQRSLAKASHGIAFRRLVYLFIHCFRRRRTLPNLVASERAEGFLGAGSYDVTFSLRSKLNIQCVIMAVDAVNVYFRRKLGPNL